MINILIEKETNIIILWAKVIEHGKYENEYKIRAIDFEGNFYYLGFNFNNYIIESVFDLPEDYEDYKYKYINNEFILNE